MPPRPYQTKRGASIPSPGDSTQATRIPSVSHPRLHSASAKSKRYLSCSRVLVALLLMMVSSTRKSSSLHYLRARRTIFLLIGYLTFSMSRKGGSLTLLTLFEL